MGEIFITGLKMGVAIAAAGTSILLVWKWIWKPLSLVRSCKQQAIPHYPSSLPLWRLLSFQKVFRLNLGSWTGLLGLGGREKVFYFVAGTKVSISIRDPPMVRQILTENERCYSKPSYIRSLKILGEGLFSASGDLWENQRKLLARIFQMKVLRNHFEVILISTLSTIQTWGNVMEDHCREVDIYDELLTLTAELIGKIALGTDLSVPLGKSTLISRTFKRYLHNKWQLSFGPAATIPGYNILNLQLRKEIYEDEHNLTNLVKEVVNNRKLLNGEKHSDPNIAYEDGHDPILIDQLLEADTLTSFCNISSLRTLDNCMTFLLAGHETTSSLLCWTVYLLSLNQMWQERARAEVQEFFSARMLWKDLSNLKLINMILYESLRLFPPQPVIGRYCMNTNKLGEYEITNGIEIFIPIAAIHRDQDLWGDDANEFRPPRFANGINGACKDPFAYLPFGSGPRTCVGQSLALTEARTILAVMLDKYSWKLSPSYKHEPDISLTLKPKYGMQILLTRL